MILGQILFFPKFILRISSSRKKIWNSSCKACYVTPLFPVAILSMQIRSIIKKKKKNNKKQQQSKWAVFVNWVNSFGV